jgi:hypothetical protein
MIPTLEARNHQAVNAKMVATAAARPETVRPSCAITCITCGATSGFATPEASIKTGGWLALDIAGTPAWSCSVSCVRRWNLRAPAEGVPQATITTAPPREAPALAQRPIPVNKGTYAQYQERLLRTKCDRCDYVHQLAQRKTADNPWQPDAARVLQMEGWQLTSDGTYCSRGCQMRVVHTPPAIVPCLMIDDRSYQIAKAAHQRPSPSRLEAREVPDSMLAKRSRA